jgi:hypothetical protein
MTERALHVQGVFFHTGCVQMSEAVTHLLLAVAQHPRVLERLLADTTGLLSSSLATCRASSLVTGTYNSHVVTEALRLFPLFGIAHRMTSKDITLPSGEVLPTGSVLCFNYPEYQTSGFEQPFVFDPDRWSDLVPAKTAYIPFGVKENRPCPAQNASLVWLSEVTKLVFSRAVLASPIDHIRSLPDRGHCLIRRRDVPMSSASVAILQAGMWLEEVVEGAFRSVAQLVLGTIMLVDARRKHPAYSYFRQPHIYS